MDHTIKIHICYAYEDQEKDVLADSYNFALKEIWIPEIKLLDQFDDWFGWFYWEENESYHDRFSLESSREIWEGSYQIINVKFCWIPQEKIDDFQDFFLKKLRSYCVFVWKFEDRRFLELRKQFFEEIYEIEIKIREIASFIFFTRYFFEDDLLKDIDINRHKISKKSQLEKYENEFFYLNFWGYKDLLKIRDLTEQEKNDILKESNSFKEYKDGIIKRGITEGLYQDFIESIKEDLQKVDNIRNSVMHYRAFPSSSLDTYKEAKKRLLEKIDNFKNQYWKDIYGNEDGLIPWKYYEFTGSHSFFIKWKKYQLVKFHGNDPVFMGENLQEDWFKDVEAKIDWKIWE